MIMHIITNFTAHGGAETMLARLLRASDDSRTVVVPLVGISDRNFSLAGNPRVRYAPLGARSVVSAPLLVRRLSRLILEERPDIILCWMYHAMIMGLIAQRLSRLPSPVFWTIRQSLDDPTALSVNSRIALALARRLSRFSSGIIYNSCRAKALHNAYGYDNSNATVIPNGFDIPELSSMQAKSPRVFGIAARLHPQKDYATFFRAAALVAQANRSARFIAAGRGLQDNNPLARSLMQEAGLRPEQIELRGEVSDMAQFYSDIDVLVLSSRTEGFPNVVAEAMSFGKPVITTDVGDSAKIVGAAGYVVPARNAPALAGAMGKALSLSADAYANLAQLAYDRIRSEYSLPAIAQRYRAFLGG
jgi:glycosyltransferase involved in cell wall biosynthesis